MKIAVLVPFYNEGENLIYFINEWEKFLKKKKKLRRNLFFFFIDDGSIDKSANIIRDNIKKISYKIIKKKNSGHGDTCKYGYQLITTKYAQYSYLLQIDSDNQCDPKYLEKFIKSAKNNYNFIFGYRNTRDDGFIRYLTSKVMALTFYLKKFIYIKDLNTPYRMMKTKFLKEIIKNINKNKNFKKIELFNCLLTYQIKIKYSIKWHDINFRNRTYGSSKFNFIKIFLIFFNFISKV